MNKTGLVLKVEKNSAILVTNTGEFVKVIASTNSPKIGETYTGTIKKEKSYIKQIIAVAALFMIFISGGGAYGAYAYYTPTATIQVSINPSIELKINRFHRIIKSSPTNTDGKTLLENLELKNKNIDDALILVIAQAKKDNFINDNYISQGKTISVEISSKGSEKTIKLDKLKRYIEENKINTTIDNNGKESKQEFIKTNTDIKTDKENKTDNNINKEAPVDDKKKQEDNSLNKNNLEKEKNLKDNNSKTIDDESTKNNNKTNNDNNTKIKPEIEENGVNKDSPGTTQQKKTNDKSEGEKEDASKSKKIFNNH